MREYTIAAIPADGIGPEVIAAGLEVLQALTQNVRGFQLKVETLPWGSHYDKRHGVMMPKNGLELLRPFSAMRDRKPGDLD
jgi:tartrate dehydrogenase/decarboxylase / D-malate dehydrogenase